MDRRVKKTKTAIFEAYIQAKKSHRGVEPSVKEICAIADINKTTFYRYYTDVEKLLYAVMNFAIDKLLIDGIKIEYLLTEPETYFRHVLKNYKEHEEDVSALLADKPQTFIFEAERILKSKLKETIVDKYDEDLCTFIAGGAAHYFLSADYSDEEKLKKFCRIIKAATSAI
ncbi:MAG: TetR/AcrR family transcriptional regulator [Clostridia bacterium]|nr:TetR/AcrR family transcriptional regulator [Clostridia bacterium]